MEMLNNRAEASNVIFFKPRENPMKNPLMQTLFAHWDSLRAGRLAPGRAEIDPRKIENVLEHAFILEQRDGGSTRFRIAGMRLCDLMGMELRAMPATAAIAPESRALFSECLARVFGMPEIIALTLAAPCPGQAPVRGEMLMLPLADDAGRITRLLGCLLATPREMTPPLRFAITGRKTTRIVTKVKNRTPQKLAGFAETQDAFIPPSPLRGQAGHLRLVDTRD